MLDIRYNILIIYYISLRTRIRAAIKLNFTPDAFINQINVKTQTAALVRV